ncbi:hypothetical protein A8144_02610 [Mycobacterium leprae 3125609]|nr:class II aldolase/adducin family protein [Mycobacterium leprae]OAR20523.1 hypothetical protein A8144_02610 [Mycobacterium leprae 3125609]OAX70364.1 hypothetical protein A3216_12375 [Mycobacterium leprae 7935681]
MVEGTAGNISARNCNGNIVITLLSVDYRDMLPDDLMLIYPEEGIIGTKASRVPSSQIKLHMACQKAFNDIDSVIHSHPGAVDHARHRS